MQLLKFFNSINLKDESSKMNNIEEMMKIVGIEPKYCYDVKLQDTINPKEK